MPHGNVESEDATAQNAATPPQAPNDKAPNDQARSEHATVRPDPSSYAAPDVRDATLAAPAAGEVGDYADLSDPSGGMAQGGDRTNRDAHAHQDEQGPKTREANRRMAASGSPDQGTH